MAKQPEPFPILGTSRLRFGCRTFDFDPTREAVGAAEHGGVDGKHSINVAALHCFAVHVHQRARGVVAAASLPLPRYQRDDGRYAPGEV
jgi:hypothetical protein